MKSKSLILAILVLFIAMTAIFSWYEGSGLMDDPHQWEYTALISGWMDDGEVLGKSEISQLDFFLYAIKFHPLFPSSMMVFFLLLLFFIGYPFKNKKYVMPLMAFYAMILIFSFMIIPNEQGTGVFLNSVRSAALILIVLSTLIWFRDRKTVEVKTSG